MIYRLLADGVLVVHAVFALFVVAGGFLAMRWRRLIWVHVPAMLWGVAVEFGGWLCPLTPLENRLRNLAGDAPYAGDFIAHYLQRLLYPVSLTRTLQLLLGAAAVLINAVAYALLVRAGGKQAKCVH